MHPVCVIIVCIVLHMIYCLCFQVSEGPSFALHRKTGEGGQFSFNSYNVKLKLQSTSERMRLGRVGGESM